MWLRPRKQAKAAKGVPAALRAEFEQLGEAVVAHIVGRPYTHSTGSTPGVPVWAGNEDDRRHAINWLRERRRRERRRFWIGPSLTVIVIGIALYNLWISKQADRPELVLTGAHMVVEPNGLSTRTLMTITWSNTGKKSALQGSVSLFTLGKDTARGEAIGRKVLTTDGSAMLLPHVGQGSIQFDVDEQKSVGPFLVCVTYHDERDYSYTQKYILQRGGLRNPNFYSLNELPWSQYPNADCPT